MFEIWAERWNRAINAAKARNARNVGLEIAPPANEDQIRNIEAAINRSVPQQFRETLLGFSREVNFYWFLQRNDDPPPPLSGIFCGGCNWDVDSLIDMYKEVNWLADNAFVEHVPEETLWQSKFPFHSIGNGDFIAIDQSSNDCQAVVYLSHELGDSHAHWLGSDFYDFMDRWTSLGCPNDDIWTRFVPDKSNYIDLDHENARVWCDWFGLPSPDRCVTRP
jgi:hypothetical protein